nr:hypothetical protein [Alphaproteobacteria bacterium]
TLADLLEACGSDNRCGSLACRKCGRAMQRCFVNAAQPWIKGLGEPVYIITIVPDVWFAESERCLIGKLSVFRNRLDAALKDADIKLAVGWYDVSLNEHSNKAHRPFWQPHLWCIVPSSQVTKPVREVLRKHFPNNPLICAAVEFQLFDGNRRAMAYGAKPNFIRRVTYPKIAGQNSRAKRRQNTKKRDLRVSQNQAMLLMCHDLGFSGRLFLHGATVRAWNEKIRFSECVAPV